VNFVTPFPWAAIHLAAVGAETGDARLGPCGHVAPANPWQPKLCGHAGGSAAFELEEPAGAQMGTGDNSAPAEPACTFDLG